ncbi:MAG: rhomboid family intramembrane serine protease [Parvibaculales bacterium]
MEKEEQSEKQPILRAPPVVLILLAVLLGFHLLSEFGGSAMRVELIVALGLFPARFFAEGLGGLPGGWVQGVVNLFSHSLLHGSWTHVILNSVWLLAFGAPVAKRLGPRKFIFLFMVCVMFGGFGQIFVSDVSGYLIPIIGASGGVAGLMGAASRFAFSDVRWLDPNAQQPGRRLLRLSEVPRRRPVMLFIAIWLIMNLVFGLLGPYGMADPSGAAVNIAWVAHLGGFLAGLLLIGLLEKPPLSASGGPGHVDYGEWKNRK